MSGDMRVAGRTCGHWGGDRYSIALGHDLPVTNRTPGFIVVDVHGREKERAKGGGFGVG